MKVFVVLVVLAVSAFAARTDKEYRTSFTSFIKTFGKHYASSEFQTRFKTFKSNLDFIDSWNANADNHRVGVNKFADLSISEFTKLYMGLNVNVVPTSNKMGTGAETPVNWTKAGAVTGVKDQGQCGSCWAFSATGSTEGAHFIKSGKLVSLSEQNLVDCSTAQGNQGCNGGLMTQAFDYIISNKGDDTEASYPYHASDGTCKFIEKDVGATLSKYTNVNSGDESDLVAKIVEGPTSVAIDASHSSFQLYQSGVYYEPACSASQLDHGVLAVGFDTDGAKPYYIVKNSWGVSWGQNGYIWMSRNVNNNCGIATMATIPFA